jgi:hypothetical protein
MIYKPLPKEDARRGDGSSGPMIRRNAPDIYNQPQTPGAKRGFYIESKDIRTWTETSMLKDSPTVDHHPWRQTPNHHWPRLQQARRKIPVSGGGATFLRIDTYPLQSIQPPAPKQPRR